MLKGDPHNFGKRVVVSSKGTVLKPRTMHWEWLLLAMDSPLRRLLDDLTFEMDYASFFCLIPPLQYFGQNNPFDGGEVEFLLATQIDYDNFICDNDILQIGRVIGLLTWLGISDLHVKNIVFGHKEGRLVFSPIDVECFLSDITIPSQTHLLPSTNLSKEQCGLSHLAGYVVTPSKVAALCFGYIEAIRFLSKNRTAIINILNGCAFRDDIPVRVILRPTRWYYDYMGKQSVLTFKFIKEEIEQMNRGDIPYFFRFISSQDVYYFDEPNHFVSVKSKFSDDIQYQIYKILNLERIIKRSDESMIKAGVMQLAKYFSDHVNGVGEFSGAQINLNKRDVFLDMANMRLRCVF